MPRTLWFRWQDSTIRSNDNGMEALAQSNGEGLYITATLIPGSYSLIAAKPGFKTEIIGPVALEVNQIVRVDFKLALGATTESVQVEAAPAQLLATESAEDLAGHLLQAGL